jgi:hypothetical protein
MFGTWEAGRTRRTARRTAVGALVGLGIVAGVGACDDDDLNLIAPVTTRAVAVFRDPTFNFSVLRTFAMPDTVIRFNPVSGAPLPVTRAFDQTALNRVRQNLFARGYVEVPNAAVTRPDFVVLVSTTAVENFNAWVGYPWFSVWGFFPGWGWFTPGFNSNWTIIYPWFTTVGVTAYDRGTLIVDLIPTSSVSQPNRTIRSAWAGVATALLDGTITANSVNAAIDQMFALSPYLTVP